MMRNKVNDTLLIIERRRLLPPAEQGEYYTRGWEG